MRLFGHKRPIRDTEGNITGQKESPVKAMTLDPLGGAFGADKKRRLIVTLGAGDVLIFRPEGTTKKREISLRAEDAYRFAIQCRANKAQLEKARSRKAAKAERRERARIDRQERALRDAAKRDGV